MWKQAHLSERQLGAFIALYTLDVGEPPKLLNASLVKFRNQVIHQGRIPTRAEALKYGQGVLDIIRSLISEAKSRFPKGIEQETHRHIISSQKEWGGEVPSTMGLATIVSLTHVDEARNNRSLEDSLGDIEAMRSIYAS